jgi:threonine dehydratase
MAADLVPLAAIVAAARRGRGVVRRTPTLDVSGRLDAGAAPGSLLILKCENLQPIGAFKIRGAYNMIACLSPKERAVGVITFSSGNHGQAVAMAAHCFGIPAVIVMPTTAAQVKVDGVRRFGAEVIFAGTTAAERLRRGHAEAAARGLTVVPPFDHPDIIAGQGTVALELLEQVPDVTRIVVSIGGGSMASGVGAVIKRMRPDIRLIGVEPAGAAKMQASLERGEPTGIPNMQSIAEGLLAVQPGALTFAHTRAFVDEVIDVTDEDMIAAMRWLFTESKLVVEPSGAVGVAAYLRGLGPIGEGPTVVILSGGNIDRDVFCRLVA